MDVKAFHQLRPGNSTQLTLGSYNFTMEEIKEIYSLYADDSLTLYQIKETKFHDAQIKELACAVTHAQMDIQQVPYDQRPRFSFDPSGIDLTQFTVGNPGANPGQ